MDYESIKIKSFKDLNAWKKGHELVLSVYNVTKSFPTEEKFGLVNQIRRCVVSITSNLAEGFSRQSYKEKVQFYSIAQGSVTELQNQILISKDIGFLTKEVYEETISKSIVVHKIISGLIKKSKQYVL